MLDKRRVRQQNLLPDQLGKQKDNKAVVDKAVVVQVVEGVTQWNPSLRQPHKWVVRAEQ